ncbi:hypothetical protein [Flavobacterium selenitireducens]|nr:hypothetical protein [Flavobacterium selenitireducens]
MKLKSFIDEMKCEMPTYFSIPIGPGLMRPDGDGLYVDSENVFG